MSKVMDTLLNRTECVETDSKQFKLVNMGPNWSKQVRMAQMGQKQAKIGYHCIKLVKTCQIEQKLFKCKKKIVKIHKVCVCRWQDWVTIGQNQFKLIIWVNMVQNWPIQVNEGQNWFKVSKLEKIGLSGSICVSKDKNR